MEKKTEFKIVVIGPSEKTGKTAIIRRFISNNYEEISWPTTLNISSKKYELEGHLYTINIFDTAGADNLRSFVKSFLKDVDGVIALYDIVNKSTLDIIDKWIKLSKEVENNEILMIVIGNK